MSKLSFSVIYNIANNEDYQSYFYFCLCQVLSALTNGKRAPKGQWFHFLNLFHLCFIMCSYFPTSVTALPPRDHIRNNFSLQHNKFELSSAHRSSLNVFLETTLSSQCSFVFLWTRQRSLAIQPQGQWLSFFYKR